MQNEPKSIPLKSQYPFSQEFLNRYWSHVEKTETCWLWTGCKGKTGYGRIKYHQKNVPAHRGSWMIHHGPIPISICVLHRCDVRNCVNPEHLFLGTQKMNNNDAARKGRSCAGEKCKLSKLKEKAVKEILALVQNGIKQAEIGRKFNVAANTVWAIARGRTWKRVTGVHFVKE